MSAILTIAIPTRNRAAMLKQCLDSVYHQHVFVDVVVCDNASTDETPEMMEKEFGGVVSYYRNEKNLGFDGNYMRYHAMDNLMKELGY